MATLAHSELGETAAKLLQTANGYPIPIMDGNRQVGALVSMEYLAELKKMHSRSAAPLISASPVTAIYSA